MDKKPRVFLVCKILAFVFFAMSITGIVLTIIGFKDFESNNFMIGGALTAVGIFCTIIFAAFGFRPEINKQMIKSQQYIQNQNKDELKSIAKTNAEINKDAVKITASAVKEGLEEDKKE